MELLSVTLWVGDGEPAKDWKWLGWWLKGGAIVLLATPALTT
jgi:hypothetical protein